jgi:hypothetical protein
MSEMDREIQRLEEGGSAWEGSEEVLDWEVKRPMDKVVPVRLTDDVWRALREEARKVGVGPSTLVRMWLMERLSTKPGKRKAS